MKLTKPEKINLTGLKNYVKMVALQLKKENKMKKMKHNYYYMLTFVEQLYKNGRGYGTLTDEGEKLVEQGIHRSYRGQFHGFSSGRNYAAYFATRKKAEKALSELPTSLSKHYEVLELMGL